MIKKACKICIAQNGLRGSDLAALPDLETDEELYDHIEAAHGIAVRREGETDEQALARVAELRAKK